MQENNYKIVSLVPSWTETLIEAGLNIVGRTRFCIHPADKIKNISAIGGTKNLKLEEILSLKPDYVILDKEENKKEMSDILRQAGIELLISHVEGLQSAADFLSMLGKRFDSIQLSDWADLYRMILSNKNQLSCEKFLSEVVLNKNSEVDINQLEYVIWKNPFMVIGQGTFISEVLSLFDIRLKRTEKYPQVSEEVLKKSYCFFSSEPYPFTRDFQQLTEEGYRGALVDGEKISWYGIRNLKFLEKCLTGL